MLFRKPTNASLDSVIAKYLPVADATGCFSALEGLSGTSFSLETEYGRFHARKLPEQRLPNLSLHRYHKILKRLSPTIAPRPYKLVDGWLLSHWMEGEPWSGPLPTAQMAELLHQLHRQPLFGWRVSIAPLLSYYWQQSSPKRRSVFWLGRLKWLLTIKEPRPLRLAPLHMDVHAGNLIQQTQGLGLIDWEYAGDGDIGLELATIMACNTFMNDDFLSRYAHLAHVELSELHRQIRRWQPWITLLVASWYECRWQQTNQPQFAVLADRAWQEMRSQENIWVR